MQKIPFRFEPDAAEFEAEHLEWKPGVGARTVTWPLIGGRLVVPDEPQDWWEALRSANAGAFRSYGQVGFSFNDYSEFFVTMPDAQYIGFDMAGVEATFGAATPLAAMLFDPFHRDKWFGPWADIGSLRILGASSDEAEAAFLNAISAYEVRFGILPQLYPIDPDLVLEFTEPVDGEEKMLPAPRMITDLDALRFFHNGMGQVDDVAACIYFYRTIEYFSFFTNSTEVTRLRHDAHVSDAEFSKRLLDLMVRDEKGPVLKLIASIADVEMLTLAARNGLSKGTSPGQFGEALYTFRNSIVHGKFSYGYSLVSGSVLESNSSVGAWKTLLCELARRSLEKFGTRRP